jgi:hypothetical protein
MPRLEGAAHRVARSMLVSRQPWCDFSALRGGSLALQGREPNCGPAARTVALPEKLG